MLIAAVHNWVICQIYCSQTIKLSGRSIAEVATDPERTRSDPDLTVFCESKLDPDPVSLKDANPDWIGSEFGFAPPNNLGTRSALLSAENFFSFGLHLNFGRKNAPIFSGKFFNFFGLYLNFGQKNAPIFSEDLFFTFWYSTEFGQKKRPNSK